MPGDGDQFGYSLALSGDGNTLAVGAITEDSAAQRRGRQSTRRFGAVGRGGVRVHAEPAAPGLSRPLSRVLTSRGGNLFGFSVALSFDGNTLAGAAFNDRGSGRTINAPHDTRAAGSGAVYVFTRQNGGWSQQAYVKASRSEPSDGFGYATAISEDGNTLAVGAGDEACLTPGVDPPGCDNDSPPQRAANIWVGAAYVFVRSGTTWTEQAFIKASNARPYNSFGVKLALSGDGNTLAVSAYLEDNAGQGVRAAGRPAVPAPGEPESMAGAPERGRGIGGGVLLHAKRRHVDARARTSRARTPTRATSSAAPWRSAATAGSMVVGAHDEDSAARGVNGNQADNSADDSGAAYVLAF